MLCTRYLLLQRLDYGMIMLDYNLIIMYFFRKYFLRTTSLHKNNATKSFFIEKRSP